ncbi:MAG: hypothetical protein V1822_03920 [Candidatus Micrarchaeota archaeon]
MILNGVIEGVEVQRSPQLQPAAQVSIDIRFVDIKEVEGNVDASFLYEATYSNDAGFLRMNGRLLLKPPSKPELEKLLDAWNSSKSLPPNFAKEAITAAHHMCSINAPLATRIVDLAPPIMPLEITFAQNGGSAAKKAERGKR